MISYAHRPILATKIGFGKTDLGKNHFWENQFGKKIGFGKTDLGKKMFWNNRFLLKLVREKQILEKTI